MMPELAFFRHYIKKQGKHTEYLRELKEEIEKVKKQLPELPFSNIWIAQNMVDKLPENCELHFGIYHSLRSWNFSNFRLKFWQNVMLVDLV